MRFREDEMPFSYELFFALYIVSMAVGIFIGLLVFVGWKDLFWRKALESARYNVLYIALVVGLPVLMLIEHIFRDPGESTREIIYTNWIFSISGNAIRILQDRLDYQLLVDFFILVYVWVFTYIIYFTPVLLLAKDDRSTLRRYAIALMFNYIVLLPFYIFFPVSVTGFYADSGITPFLYINTNWGRMVTSVDPLDNDFPSAHVSLILTGLLVLLAAGQDYKRYSYFLAAATVGITFSVLYLGVHWLADVFGGFLLAVGAVLFSGSERIQMAFDRYVRKITRKLTKEKEGRAV
ncbi:MAG: hypothetical protein A3K75_00645 [Euryarchaeota archaeon RBG_13_61_15]|jgi:membrane-associated phospholipid phosphatase|nr:MAG: hypothetical protein A3K75_00645 [Euryarchaeota archaeon RBG_13_61_15]